MGHKVNRFPSAFAILSVVALFILGGCAWFHPEKGLKSCRYGFRNLAFESMDLGQTHWRLDVIVTNPNAHPVTLSKMRFALMHEADTLLSGWNPAQRQIAAGDSQVIQTTLDLPNSVWKRLPSGIWSDTDARFVIAADAYLSTWVGDLTIPGALRQTIHVNMPQQMAKYRDMVMQKLFNWPGTHLSDEGKPPPGPDDGDAPQSPADAAPPDSAF